ncbi:hypothetical protein QBC46DRAFT_373950 [Diplogelasinospora grovesii]|uniref:Secreted protein n=1 Tax=Diplogelasinospora grovesii TaxID=303347 RepID=A0AAN6NF47_9PEZI|nr:hypothetical protein QBC46DRAFT_373950 [Diplogelasinospora grovesii]
MALRWFGAILIFDLSRVVDATESRRPSNHPQASPSASFTQPLLRCLSSALFTSLPSKLATARSPSLFLFTPQHVGYPLLIL